MPEGWVNVFDVQREAERKLDPGPLGYFSGGAGDELTLRENVDAWRDWRLRPRQLTGIEAVSTEVEVLGAPVDARSSSPRSPTSACSTRRARRRPPAPPPRPGA